MTSDTHAPCTTVEAARLLGLAVRSVQSMVDRGELDAWKTPGGHRRISRASIDRWLTARTAPSAPPTPGAQVLLIDDSVHYQNLVSLLVRERFPNLQLRTATDGITGLAMYGALRPDLLIVDILLPGIDGAALITALRSQPQFAQSRLVVLTGLDEAQRKPYEFALQGVPVVHKPRLVLDLPPLLQALLPAPAAAVMS